MRKIGVAGAGEEYQRYMVRMYEVAEVHLHNLQIGKNSTSPGVGVPPQIVAIYDMAGFNVKLGACYKCLAMLPELASNYALNYPLLAYRSFFINCEC
jgi:hypothetical protein